MSSTVRFTSNKDVALLQKLTSLGAGGGNHLPVGYGPTGDRFRVAVAFSTTGMPTTGRIVSAVLSVKTSTGSHLALKTDPNIYVERITSGAITENGGNCDSLFSSATSNYGDVGSTTTHRKLWDVGGASAPAAETYYTTDITDLFEDIAPTGVLRRDGTACGGSAFYGLLFRSYTETADTNNVEFYSRSAAAASILLTYDANTVPAAPSGLAPTGSLSRLLTMSGTFSDAGDTMSKLDIQVSTVSTFASVTHWDYSGVGFGMAGTTWSIAYAGSALAAGVYYFRARVYDSYNAASPWSSVASFTKSASVSSVRSFRAGAPRIEIFTAGASTNWGPGTLQAMIDDAKFIGVSGYANEVGEMFFTLPYNHPQLAALTTDQIPFRHYRVSRYDDYTGTYKTVARGTIQDLEHAGDEVVVRGDDYMGLMELSITNNNQTYSNQYVGTIIQDQVSSGIWESSSHRRFTGIGTIDQTSVTTTLLTSAQPRLDLIRECVSIAAATSSVRSVFGINRDSPYNWFFTQNKGSEELTGVRLEYGGALNGFLYIPGWRNFATTIRSIGLKVEGASVLYSSQSYASTATYGVVPRFRLFRNVIDQAALDKLTLRAARDAGVPAKQVMVLLRANQLIPWGGWDYGDSIRVVVNRGAAANLNALYTIWGMEWTVEPNGRENLYLALSSKVTS